MGLIGLLVAAILADGGGRGGAKVIAVDPLADRRHLARCLGVTSAAAPAELARELRGLSDGDNSDGALDISVEVSGHPSGLQGALDATGYGGTVVLGSWYGGEPLKGLRLGMAFHRSHLDIRVSQVSTIAPKLRGRWSKDRRFHEAWETLRRLRPALALGARVMNLARAQEAFALLDEGKELAIVFDLRA
mmetsp:Transcript_46434/g.145308  ORF Transcript_46434/g.145308 Transcript_46434/m.145308 type:complete len:190 (-) Transcript_46434:35-604(-)